jgi:hypothetical protein
MAINPNVSPADIAGTVQPPATNIRIAEVPSGMPTTPAPAAPPADYKKFKGIYDAFAPVQQMQQKQVAGVNDRYAANAADIKNLFGTLTTMREQDKVKIQEQFVNTLVAQQEMLAGRTAEVRKSTQAGVDAAQQAATELGGPATGPVTSLTQQAAERGIAQSNALSTIWQNQMASQNMNTQASIQNQIAGYGGQQANITKELGSKRESQLMQLQGQQSEIDQQIAQAKNDYNTAVSNNNAAAAREAANRANQYAIAKLNNDTDLIIAREKLAGTPKAYPASLTGWNSKVQDLGGDPRVYVDGIESAREKASGPVTGSGAPVAKPSKAQIIAQWKTSNPDWTAEELAIVAEYLKYVP